MNRVDKINGILLGLCVVAVTVLAGLKVIEGSVAVGFISGIGTAMISLGTARVVDSKTTKNNSDSK